MQFNVYNISYASNFTLNSQSSMWMGPKVLVVKRMQLVSLQYREQEFNQSFLRWNNFLNYDETEVQRYFLVMNFRAIYM